MVRPDIHTLVTTDDFAFAGKIRALVEKGRVACELHIGALAKLGKANPLADAIFPDLESIEERIEAAMRRGAAAHPAWYWASKVKGCGPTVFSAVVSRVDINRVRTISAMWAHFGFRPGQKRTAGQKLDFDSIGKTWCWRLGNQLIRYESKFRDVYERRRVYELEAAKVRGVGYVVYIKRPSSQQEADRISLGQLGLEPIFLNQARDLATSEISVGQVHMRALRYTIKMWLACLWLVWREAEGLEIAPPYIIGKIDGTGHHHTTFHQPWEFTDR